MPPLTSDQTATLLVFLAIDLLVALLAYLMPRASRPEIFFAVRVDPALPRESVGRQALAAYRNAVHFGVVAAAALLGAGWALAAVWPAVVSPVAEIAAVYVGFLAARRRVLPRAIRETPDRPKAERGPREPLVGGPFWQALPFAALAALAWHLWTLLPGAPARLPEHWNFAGAVDRWGATNGFTITEPAWICAAVALLLLLVQIGVQRWTPTLPQAAPGREHERHFRRLVGFVLLFGEYLVVAAGVWGALARIEIARGGSSPLSGWVVLAASVAYAAVVITLLIRAGQGGSRRAREGKEASAPETTRNEAWKAGVFYYAPEDPAIFVEKRFGLGYTVNFGNPWSWVILGGILLLIGLSLVVGIAA